MASEASLQLPKIPLLKGEENLEEWKDLLIDTLTIQDLDRYILTDVPQPEAQDDAQLWRINRAKVMLIIKGSLTHVSKTLESAGWNRFEEKNPKKLYDLIQSAIPRVSADAAGDLVAEFGHINVRSFDTLQAYQTRLQYLKRRTQELDCGFQEKACLWFGINGLKETYEQWYTFLVRDMNKGILTWELLMAEIYAEANKQRNSMNLATIPKSTNQPPPTSSQPVPQYPLRQPVVQCDTCQRKHPENWPLCNYCKKHHKGNEDKCWKKHPELEAEYKARKTKKSDSNSNQGNQSTASPSALSYNSGASAALHTTLTRDSVIADTGASSHTFNDIKWFTELKPLDDIYEMSSANGGTLSATYTGSVTLRLCTSSGVVNTLNLFNVKYCPMAPLNMLSLGQLRHDGLVINGMTDQLIIKATNQELTTLNWISKIAIFQLERLPQASTLPLPHTPTPFKPSIDDSEDLGEEVAFMALSLPQLLKQPQQLQQTKSPSPKQKRNRRPKKKRELEQNKGNTNSQNARLITLNPLISARTRYIDIRYKWVSDRVKRGDFDLQHVSTNDMVADGLTKPLNKAKHMVFVKQLGLCVLN